MEEGTGGPESPKGPLAAFVVGLWIVLSFMAIAVGASIATDISRQRQLQTQAHDYLASAAAAFDANDGWFGNLGVLDDLARNHTEPADRLALDEVVRQGGNIHVWLANGSVPRPAQRLNAALLREVDDTAAWSTSFRRAIDANDSVLLNVTVVQYRGGFCPAASDVVDATSSFASWFTTNKRLDDASAAHAFGTRFVDHLSSKCPDLA